MKARFSLILIGLFFTMILLESYHDGPAKHGARATNAPGDGPNKCSSCHNGGGYGSVSVDLFMISDSGDTITEYKPDSSYNAVVEVHHTAGNPSKYGFQMISLKNINDENYNGWSNPGDGVRQSTSNARNYVEHNDPSVSNTFTILWKAPAEGTGQIDFYLAGNAVNGNGNQSGDNAGYGSLSLGEYTTPIDTTPPQFVNELVIGDNLLVFPNPVNEFLIFNNNSVSEYSIYNYKGELILKGEVISKTVDLRDLPSGSYFMVSHNTVQKFIKL